MKEKAPLQLNPLRQVSAKSRSIEVRNSLSSSSNNEISKFFDGQKTDLEKAQQLTSKSRENTFENGFNQDDDRNSSLSNSSSQSVSSFLPKIDNRFLPK